MKKKLFLCLLTIGIFILFLCGCERKSNLKEADCFNKFDVWEIWSADAYPETNEEEKVRERSFRYIGCNGEERFFLDSVTLDSEASGITNLVNRVYKTNDLGNGFHPIDHLIIPDFNIVRCAMNRDGKLVLFMTSYLSEGGDEMFCLYDTKEDRMIKEVKIADEVSASKQHPYIPHVQEIFCDADCIYVKSNEDSIYVYDYSLNNIGYKETDKKGETIVPIPANDGYSFVFGKEIYRFKKDDFFKEKGVYQKAIPGKGTWDKLELQQGNSLYEFFYFFPHTTGNIEEQEEKYTGVMIGVTKDGNAEKIFSFQNMGFSPDMVFCFDMYDEQSFMIGVFENINGRLTEKYYGLKRADKEYSVKEKKQTATIVGLQSGRLRHMILDYNAQSEDYYIEFIDYNTGDDYETAKQSLLVDIASSAEIDAVLLNGLDKNSLIEKEALDNLYEFFQNSEVISESDFVDWLFEGMMYSEGEIYSIYPEVSFEGIITAERMRGMDFFQWEMNSDEKQCIAFEYINDPVDRLMYIMKYSGDLFVDSKSKAVHFDENFVQILEYLKNVQNSKVRSDNPTQMLQEGRVMAKYGSFEIPYSYFFAKELLDGKVNCTNISTDGPIIVADEEIGILSYSANKEVIYDFLDYMFTEENYHRYYGNLKFPVLKSAWDDWETRLTAETDYVDRFGDTIVSVDFEYYENDVRAVIKPVEDNDIDEMNELFKRSKYVEPMPEQYLSVIAEEAAYYFSGGRTAQETCEMIENRLQIAVEE